VIFIEVRCDKCGSVGLSRRCFYAHQMREELKKTGWKHVAEGGKDFCPKCKLQVQAPSKASEALTYDGRAGKQREKNGARLTGGHA